MKAVCAAVALVVGWGCNPAAKAHNSEPAPATTHAVASPHTEDEDAHPPRAARAVPTATALTAAVRPQLTTLRISAHRGGIIIRKGERGWTLSGPQGCTVAPSRIELALDNLSALHAVATNERPAEGSDFELQIVALVGEERALHFDIADRTGGLDLLQLPNEATFRLRGLDRELWSPEARVWCAPEQ